MNCVITNVGICGLSGDFRYQFLPGRRLIAHIEMFLEVMRNG